MNTENFFQRKYLIETKTINIICKNAEKYYYQNMGVKSFKSRTRTVVNTP